jgi:tRNA (guanine-N7-)-methyltransferase
VPFAVVQPLWLEVGFGGGEHALALARAHPGINLIAAEVFETGICALLSRLAPEGAPPPPPNLRLFTDDARPLLRALPAGALSALFLMFPDPWPKARHAKRRFVHPELVAEAARALHQGAEWRIASDDPTYQAWTDDVLAAQDVFTVASASARPDGWPPTRYEAKALEAGRAPRYWRLVRR